VEEERRVVLNMRLDPATRAVMDALASKYGLSRSAVVRQAVRRWAMAEDIDVPPAERQGKAAA
jgi:predicted transcriptional regulator